MELDFQLEDLDEAEQMLVQVSFLQSNNFRAKLKCFFSNMLEFFLSKLNNNIIA